MPADADTPDTLVSRLPDTSDTPDTLVSRLPDTPDTPDNHDTLDTWIPQLLGILETTDTKMLGCWVGETYSPILKGHRLSAIILSNPTTHRVYRL